ncbi:MAG: aerobic sulfatase maturase family protein, partial [Candidatus Solibacter sp.]|nr:aerobic sulfatase maturase family protein [Candidatus Solibacter sp.]
MRCKVGEMAKWERQWMAAAACAALLAAEGARQTTNSIGIALVEIPAGSFQMGVDSTPIPAELLKGPNGVIYDRPSNEGDYDEAPVHQVTISKPFLLSVTEVTVEQFQKFRPGYRGSAHYAPYVSGVSWNDAVAFCEWLSKKEGKAYRLPTEAEWEYAARAGKRTLFTEPNE